MWWNVRHGTVTAIYGDIIECVVHIVRNKTHFLIYYDKFARQSTDNLLVRTMARLGYGNSLIARLPLKRLGKTPTHLNMAPRIIIFKPRHEHITTFWNHCTSCPSNVESILISFCMCSDVPMARQCVCRHLEATSSTRGRRTKIFV